MQRLVVIPKPYEAVPRPLPATRAVQEPDWEPIARRIAAARNEHLMTLERVRSVLSARPVESVWLDEPGPGALADAGLVVTIGGDGTFLTTARHAGRVPVLGVNSSPSTSTGHYCAATADTFAAALDRALGHLDGASDDAPVALTRIRADVDGEALPFDALNDILFAHRVPVVSTRYGLRVGETAELHLSSGIWIATAAGSTAAIRSAGGEVMDMRDRRIQWKVREPYLRGDDRLALGGGLTDDAIEILSRSDRNALFIDGHPEPYTVPFGARARLAPSPDPLFAFLFPAGL